MRKLICFTTFFILLTLKAETQGFDNGSTLMRIENPISQIKFERFLSEKGFTGLRCGPVNHRTSDQYCCAYENGRLLGCSLKSN